MKKWRFFDINQILFVVKMTQCSILASRCSPKLRLDDFVIYFIYFINKKFMLRINETLFFRLPEILQDSKLNFRKTA